MLQKNNISCEDITLLSKLVEEIRKYQGFDDWLFGVEECFMENVNIDSINIIKQQGSMVVTGKDRDYDFKIHKCGNSLKIEKFSMYSDVAILRFIDDDGKVHTNTIITNYKVSNNPILKFKSTRGKGTATLLCDRDGNFISQEQFLDIHEPFEDNKSFKPYIRHEFLHAIDDDVVLKKSHKSYYYGVTQPEYTYSKYIIAERLDSKALLACGTIDKWTYDELLEEASSKKEETGNTKRKNRIFKHKA